jgi:hypothetical protein
MSIILASILFFVSPAFSQAEEQVPLVQELDIVTPVVLIYSAGSTCAGSLVSPDGDVLTAYHCVEKHRPIVVTTATGETFDAELRLTDRRNDLAFLSVDGLVGHPYFVLGGEAVVGQQVTVVGHPLGSLAVRVPVLDGLLRWSVTDGSVSAVGDYLVQLDTAFNPGTSGGPVLDSQGQILGVASRKLRGERLSFAVPSRLASNLLNETELPYLTGSVMFDAELNMPVDNSTTSLLVGPVVEFRDRLLVEGLLGVPLAAQWNTLATGETSWRAWEFQILLRLRFSTSNGTFTADLGGGFAGTATQEGTITEEGLFHPITTIGQPASTMSLRLGVGAWRLGLAGGEDGRWGITVSRTILGGLLRF